MTDFINENFAAKQWLHHAIQNRAQAFGKLVPAVIWTDARGADGELLIPVVPTELVAEINEGRQILLHSHDPGRPVGQVLECAEFKSEDGRQFVVAVLGYYFGGDTRDFAELDLDTKTPAEIETHLPELPSNSWIEFATDSSEINKEWVDNATVGAPVPIKRRQLSHNAAEAHHELITIGLTYLMVVWNPFIKSIASEAGKSTYASVNKWIRSLIERLAELRNPILDFHTFQNDCQVSFIMRGRDVKRHYAAHDALPEAAVRAAQLISKLKEREMPARRLVYEYDPDGIWYPSYAILNDDRIITDNGALIAIENLPTGLSLGLMQK